MDQFIRPSSTHLMDITRVYQEPPVVYDQLAFYVPTTEPTCSRTVQIEDTFYEVWSPNCDKVDFYPGAPLNTVLPSYHTPPFHYIDGRLGPRDWTLHPQHFNPKAPWLGFSQRPPTATSQPWRSMNPELVPLRAVWQSPSIRPENGCLDPEYRSILKSRANDLRKKVRAYRYPYDEDAESLHVQNYRPFYPTEEDVEIVVSQSSCNFHDMVDPFTAIQRGMREMEAWLTMMNSWKFRGHTSPLSIPMANSDRVGVWLNGASKLDGYWLLRIGIIPVYVIHIYQEDIDFPGSRTSVRDRRPQKYDVDFVRHTRAERLNSPTWNTYLVAPSPTGWEGTSAIVSDDYQQVAQFVRDEKSSTRSASWSFRVSQRNSKLPADDTPQMQPAMDTTYAGRNGGLAGIAQGDPTSLLPITAP
jgi:hypothetical protein